MLLLTFDVAGQRYAVDVARVVEVVPRIPLRGIPHAPAYLAGLLNVGGGLVPVVDLGVMLGAGPCRERLSTRIILVDASSAHWPGVRLGLVAEQVTELQQVSLDRPAGAAARLAEAPYLGPVVALGEVLVQLLDVAEILPGEMRTTLYEGLLGGVSAGAGDGG